MGVAERRQREREERREAIVDAAEQVFFGRGVEAATMDDVAQAAELSKGALYLYFKSKEELYTAVINRCHGALLEDLEREARAPVRGLDLVAALARAYVRFVHKFPMHTRLMCAAMATGRFVPTDVSNYEQHRELRNRELDVVMGAIERGKRDGSIRADVEPKELAVHLWGGLMGMIMLALNSDHFMKEWPEPVDMDAAVPSFIDLLLRGFAAQPADIQRLSGVA